MWYSLNMEHNIVKGKELPRNKLLREVARENRKKGNLAEILLWKQLKNKQFMGLDFDRQRIIGNLIVDFYCPKKRLVIEVYGNSHKGKEQYDATRDEFLKSLSLHIIHLTDFDVKTNMPAILKKLEILIRQIP